LLAIFCPPAIALLAGLVGVAVPTLGLGTLFGIAAGAAVLGILSFLFGGRAIQLLCQGREEVNYQEILLGSARVSTT
jgi:hypothetical protein